MIKLTNNLFIILQSMCVTLLLCAILLDIPWYLKYYIFPITSLIFMFFLAILRINEMRESIIERYSKLIENNANNAIWLNNELHEVSKKRSYIAFNKIHKVKYEILTSFLSKQATGTVLSSSFSDAPILQQANQKEDSLSTSIKNDVEQYNKALYDKVWQFIEEYITVTLTPFFTHESINIIKDSTYEFFINDKRKLKVNDKVAIPSYLSMQDIAHFFHNISELMSYYKKMKLIDYFNFIPEFVDFADYDPQSLYRNSTRTSSSSNIPLYKISDDNNMISDFVKKVRKELPNNQRIIS